MDVFLFQTPDNGDIEVIDGRVTLSAGLDTASYLSLFGGNLADDGSQNNQFNWWGNLSEPDPSFHYRSELQHLVGTIPATSGNLKRLADAAARDLKWLTDVGAAEKIETTATLTGLNCVSLKVEIRESGGGDFEENWSLQLR